MAVNTSAQFYSDQDESTLPLGRVAFLMTRPSITDVQLEKRTPGTVYAYYDPSNGFAELYVVDPSGFKFMALS